MKYLETGNECGGRRCVGEDERMEERGGGMRSDARGKRKNEASGK